MCGLLQGDIGINEESFPDVSQTLYRSVLYFLPNNTDIDTRDTDGLDNNRI